MKRFIQGMLALTFGVLTLAAQNPSAPANDQKPTEDQHMRHARGGKMDRMHEHQMGFMARELNLTDAQKQQLQTFHEQQRTKVQEIRNNQSLTQEQKQEQMKALRQSGHDQMLSILTPEQKTKMEQLRAERKDRMEDRKERHMERRKHRDNAGETKTEPK